MEMDWGTALIGIISILICIVPFVVMYYNKTKKENKMLQSLQADAAQKNANISQNGYCNNFSIGIDESKNYVFFFKQDKEESISQFVDLAEIQTCQVVKNTRSVKNDSGNVETIESVEISFIPTNKNNAVTSFELYNEEINVQLNGELQFADKWTQKINERLKLMQ